MERQLKERLIGAAVLVAVAVVLVPEMFSGAASRVAAAADQGVAANSVGDADASASSGQLKTYHIQLQDRGGAAPPAMAPMVSRAPATSAPVTEMAAVNQGSSASSVESGEAKTGSASSATGNELKTPPSAAASSSSAAKSAEAQQTLAEPMKKPAAAIDNQNTKSWVVQVGSFGAEAKAKQIVTHLKAQDFAAYSGPVSVNGKTLYRVRVGAAADRVTADGLLKRLKGSYPEASVVLQPH